MPVAAIIDQLTIEIKKDKLCLEVIPFKEADRQSEDVSIVVAQAHDFKHIALTLFLQALLQVCRVVLDVGKSNYSLNGNQDNAAHSLLESDPSRVECEVRDQILNKLRLLLLVDCLVRVLQGNACPDSVGQDRLRVLVHGILSLNHDSQSYRNDIVFECPWIFLRAEVW